MGKLIASFVPLRLAAKTKSRQVYCVKPKDKNKNDNSEFQQ